MSVRALVVIALILIIILLIVYFIYDKDDTKRKRYKEFYNQSIGDYDENSARALETIETIARPNAEDNFYAGDIIARNILQGNLRQANPEMATQVVFYYGNAVNEIERQPNEVDEVMAMFILDQVNNFIVQNLLAEGQIDQEDVRLQPILMNLEFIGQRIPGAQRHLAQERARDASQVATTRKEFVDEYIENSQAHVNDPQNVHDPSVIKNLNETASKLQLTERKKVSIEDTLDEIKEHIRRNAGKLGEANAVKANRTLETMSKVNAFISSYGMHEEYILKCVWDRSYLQENAPNADKMRMAVARALADCVEHDAVVCSTGRASQMLGALVLLDVDPGLGKAMTYQEYKNEIYKEAQAIIEEEIGNALESDDPGMQALGRSYEDPGETFPKEAEETFRATVQKRVDDMLEDYREYLRDDQIEELRQDCYLAVS